MYLGALLAPKRAAIAQVEISMQRDSVIERVDPESVPRPKLRSLRITVPMTVDGILDELVWLQADSTWGFMQSIPVDGYPMPERTVVRVLYDDDHLYVGARMYQANPDKLMVPGLEQDYPPYEADAFTVVLDPNHDRQTAYIISMSSAGAVWDGQAFNDSRWVNPAWEGVYHVAAHVDELGWTAEMEIPFTTLRFDPREGEQTWGIQFVRRIRAGGRVDGYWAPLLRRYGSHKMSRAGTLTGLRGIRQGRNLQVKPFVSGSRLEGASRAVDELGNDASAGVDVKYGITSRITMDLTALTDFSQVEVDQEQVNLTRFSLFFPEKRDFFMENAGVFTMGDVMEAGYRTGSSTRNFTLFHSRRIGLSADRRPIPILGGARVTGRAGDFEIGVLDMQTREFGDSAASGYVPAENFAVLRLRRDILGNSDIGVLFTNRQATTGGFTDQYNRAFAADANFRLFQQRLLVGSYIAATDEPDVVGDRYAARVSVGWRDRVWDTSAFVKQVGDGFNPGVGYVQRSGIRHGYATLGAHPEVPIPHLQEINPYGEVSVITDLDGVLETRDLTAGLGMTLNDGGRISLTYTNTFERLKDVTRISGINVAAGDYEFNDAAISYRPSPSSVLSGSVQASHGGFFDGDRTSATATVQFRPDRHLTMNVSAQHNDVTLAGTSFTADVFAGRVRYAYNTKLHALAFVQFNDSSDELVANVRFNIIHAPLSDVFFVYTERRYVGDDQLLPDLLERTVSVKATKLFAF
jgi:hypothetical protein